MRVIVVVEGVNDIEFLRRMSLILRDHDASLPNLAEMEQQGALLFMPFGGGSASAWTHRLAPLGKPEFHLLDHELPPETDDRYKAVKAINGRPNCEAVLTGKRSLENYLHPAAIAAAGQIGLQFGDFDDVAEMTAKRFFQIRLNNAPWELLPRRARRRLMNRAKRWLNTQAVAHMTADMLRQRDPDGEVISWLLAIDRLAASL